MTRAELAAVIDHTCLAPDATAADIDRLCDAAVEYGFHAVCVAPSRVDAAVRHLANESPRVCATVGFPHGNTLPCAKVTEARAVLEQGAREVDMVMQLGAFTDGDDVSTGEEIAQIAEVVHAVPGGLLKVILETAYLSDAQIAHACRLAVSAGADFVKTSTGFGPAGATVGHVRLMRAAVGEGVGVKAAGGIRDAATALAMLEAGATRLGASASVAILEGL